MRILYNDESIFVIGYSAKGFPSHLISKAPASSVFGPDWNRISNPNTGIKAVHNAPSKEGKMLIFIF
jgi:hypothetical protein